MLLILVSYNHCESDSNFYFFPVFFFVRVLHWSATSLRALASHVIELSSSNFIMTSKVVVFGGNGFVGSNILKVLRARSVDAISVSRSGVKPKHLEGQSWAAEIAWTRGDALTPASYQDALKGASAVVISVGSPPVPVADVAWQTMQNGGKEKPP